MSTCIIIEFLWIRMNETPDDLDLKLIAENCHREQSSYKNCLRYGEANYQKMKERMFFAPLSNEENIGFKRLVNFKGDYLSYLFYFWGLFFFQSINRARVMPNQHYPHECDVLLENERNCLAFWTKISGNYNKKGLFKERTGTPDASARQFILEEMKSMQKLPYIGTIYFIASAIKRI